MRNEVGIRFDYSNPRRLWGVENGVDSVQRVYVVALVALTILATQAHSPQ